MLAICAAALAAALSAVAQAAASGRHAPLPRPLKGAGFVCHWRVPYGPRPDYPDEGDGFKGKIGNWKAPGLPVRICRHCSGQNMDIYVPDNIAANPAAVLYVHGGTWSHCFDRGAVPPAVLKAFMSEGAILASPDYILQIDNTMNVSDAKRPEATFERMLRDVDEAAARFAAALGELGVAPSRFAIAGESAGAHLALLYAYDQANPAALGLGLEHPLKFDVVADIAGPVDLPAFGDLGAGAGGPASKRDVLTSMRLLVKRLAGLADDAPDADAVAAAARWSPARLVCASSPRTVLAYGRLARFVPTDGVIPVSQRHILEKRLKEAGVEFSSREFTGIDHGRVSAKSAPWVVREVCHP